MKQGNKQNALGIQEVEINPAMAQVILDAHENYRKLSERRVDCYTQLMLNGEWGKSMLIFDDDGILVDGQTRLNAVIKSNTTQTFIIIKGWDKNEVINIDNNQTRTREQAFKYHINKGNGNVLSAIAVAIEDGWYQTGIVRTHLQAIELYEKHKDIVDLVDQTLGNHMRHLQSGFCKSAFALALRNNPDRKNDIIEAMEHLREYNFPDDRDLGLKLYAQHYIGSDLSKGDGTRSEIFSKLCRAIKAFLNNEKLTKLYVPKNKVF